MGTAGAIFNETQTYGNGEVILKGGFTDVSSAANITHGLGFQVARGLSTGVYKITLQPAGNTSLTWKGLLSGVSKLVAAASTGDATYTNPGSVVMGDLQSDGKTVYAYVYDDSNTQGWLPSGVAVHFHLTMSTSTLNP